MKKLRITIKEFYEELHPLLESENVKFSYKRHGSHMKVEVSQDFCTKFGYWLTTLLITFVIIFIVILLTYYLHTKNKIIIPYKKEIIIEPVRNTHFSWRLF